jgi:hypothetical protein
MIAVGMSLRPIHFYKNRLEAISEEKREVLSTIKPLEDTVNIQGKRIFISPKKEYYHYLPIFLVESCSFSLKSFIP